MLHRLLGIVALIALLAACGGAPAAPEPMSASAAVEPTSATVPTSAPAFSVQTHTITHALGEIDVPASPQRIVVLDYNTVEELIALGITPIGVLYDPPPWLAPSLTGVEVVGNDGQPNIEKILLLKPDLIIGWPPLMGDATYENLATIAPTVILEKPSFAVWKQTFRYLADVVGKQQVAEDLLNTYSSRTAELRERIGEETTRQLQVSFFRVTGDGSALRVAGVNSFAGSVLADVGFDRPPAQKNSADEELEISLERLDLADGDVLFVGARQDNPDSVRVVEQLKTNPLWLTLSAVKAQRVFDVDSNRWLEGSILNATFILADLERHLSSGITNVPATTTRTVTDDLGRTVDVPARPQRVVALHDLQVLRPLLDLGVTPIASVTHPLAVGAFRFVEEYDVSGIAIIGLLGEPNLEQLTLLKPDMIIGTLSAGTDEQIETLSAIAPTVVYNAGRPVIAYHRLLAEAIGTLDAYDALMADYETRLAELRAGIAPISADLVVSLLAFNPNAGQIQIGEGPYTLIFRGAGIQQPELAPERLEAFAAYRQDVGEVRDLLVCTHGSVDAACSKFGYLTYVHLRKLAADSGGRLRAWRTTHFGGHVFAPTLIDMPHGSYWAYIEQEEAEALVGRSGAVARLREHYRGWAGLPAPFLQVLERELFVRFGWEWLQYAKAGRVLTQDETAEPDDHGHAEPVWAEVHLDYRAPNGVGGSVTARVELTKRVEVIHTSGGTETYAYPQYAVAWLREDEERVQRLLDQAYR